MENKKQTAVDWLIDEAIKLVIQYMNGTLNEDTLDDVIYEIGTKAKQMEKEQIINAHGDEQSYLQDNGSWRRVTAEQYYNERYGSESPKETTSSLPNVNPDDVIPSTPQFVKETII